MDREAVWAEMQKNICEVLPFLKEGEFSGTDRLADLGANSIDRAHIITLTLESLNLTMPLTETFKAQNIGELVDLFHRRLNGA